MSEQPHDVSSDGAPDVAPGDVSEAAPDESAPDDNPDGPHPFVYPADPAEYAAAKKKAYDDEMHARIIARLKKIPYSKRGRWAARGRLVAGRK
jgi:hypothetical protein